MADKGPSSRFVKVRCVKCKNEQIIFGKAASTVNCLVCNDVLAVPTSCKAKVKGQVLEVLS